MEKTEKNRLFRWGDAVVALLVLLLALALLWLFFAQGRGTTARVLVEGELVATLALSQNTTLPIQSRGYCLTVIVEDGTVFVTDATCPDQVCAHSGKISTKGASIVCAAAAVSVRILGGGDGDADFVAG